jgi:glycosyltransferase involved in cell wall biosynthesis
MTQDINSLELTVVMPCLNEAETLAVCIEKAINSLRKNNIEGEVLIADNGSTDGSQKIATDLGARVVQVEEKGYGSALIGGIMSAKGRFVIMGDADDSYDFSNLLPFVEKLREGYELVMGNRFMGGISPGAMPSLHKYLGNPVLTGIGRVLFRSPSGDFHCGLRGFRRSSILKLDLRTTGMEFASEMVVKATLNNLRIAEVPTTLSPDGRSRAPHLRSWRDGWRHLRFMLLYSPKWLFLYPGLLLMLSGVIAGLWLLPGSRDVGFLSFNTSTLLYSAMAVIVGFQAITFAMFTKCFAITEGLLPKDEVFTRFIDKLSLEFGLIVGSFLLVGGLLTSIYAVFFWGARSFGPFEITDFLRIIIPAVTLITLGFQTILTSFFLSILCLKHR